VGEGKSPGVESAPARGYIHGDSARCAVTERLDVERLAASRGRYLSYSRTTLLVPRYGYIANCEVPASTYVHLVVQSHSPGGGKNGGRRGDSREILRRRLFALISSEQTILERLFSLFPSLLLSVLLSMVASRTIRRRHCSRSFGSLRQMDSIVPGIIVIREIFSQRERERHTGERGESRLVLKSFRAE